MRTHSCFRRFRRDITRAGYRVAAAAVLAAFCSLGCGAKIHRYERVDGDVDIPSRALVCVLVGEDARTPDGPRGLPFKWPGSGETLYEGSARVVADYVPMVLQKTRPSTILVQPKDPKSPLPDTTAAGCLYAVLPTIIRWEDRSQLAGRDQVGIVLHLIQLDPWTPIRSVKFEQHSGNAVIKDQPASDILNDGFEVAIAKLVPPPGPPKFPASAVKAVALP
jgi:hypothetical protein